jgi:hypothetical protein
MSSHDFSIFYAWDSVTASKSRTTGSTQTMGGLDAYFHTPYASVCSNGGNDAAEYRAGQITNSDKLLLAATTLYVQAGPADLG